MSPLSIHNQLAKQFLIQLEQQDYDDFFDYDIPLEFQVVDELKYEVA